MSYSERQLEIMHAALQIISISGIQALTTKSLAASMGFSEPALYRHFKNKVEILESLLSFYKSEMKAPIREVLESEKNNIEKLQGMLSEQFAYFQENKAMVLLVFSESIFQSEARLSALVKETIQSKLKLVERLIEEGQLAGIIRKDETPKALATVYIGAIRFTLMRWKLEAYSFNLNEEATQLNKTIANLLK
jgi:AcrR family transcriptional regulator